ncbi:MAG: PHP domain-containing protein, partial [Kingella oralis]
MIDLHTHSTISDGALTPTQLVQAAAQNGCRLLALTDHDHTGGLAEARAEAARHGIRFINGAEISVTWRHRTLHIVALDFDEHNSSLQTLLAQVRQGRIERLHQIAAKLAKRGIEGAAEGALALAANPEMVSRTHIADWLVQQGHARTKQQAFTRYLGDGKSASVRHQWAELPAAIAAIQDAGGIAVIAHP